MTPPSRSLSNVAIQVNIFVALKVNKRYSAGAPHAPESDSGNPASLAGTITCVESGANMLDTQAKSSYRNGMNKLPLAKRVQILSMLCEGSSMRSVARVADVSFNTVLKLLIDAGKVCAAFHDEHVRGVT